MSNTPQMNTCKDCCHYLSRGACQSQLISTDADDDSCPEFEESMYGDTKEGETMTIEIAKVNDSLDIGDLVTEYLVAKIVDAVDIQIPLSTWDDLERIRVEIKRIIGRDIRGKVQELKEFNGDIQVCHKCGTVDVCKGDNHTCIRPDWMD